MKILAIESSTEACSAALSVDGEVSEKFEIAPSRHSSLLLPMIDSLLTEAQLTLGQLDALGFSAGPGSFTGLRIAAGVIQGIATGADLPVVAVSTLEALALRAQRINKQDNIMAALDARKNEVYWAMFRYKNEGNEGYMHRESSDCVCSPGQVPLPDAGDWFGIGPGWTHYADDLLARTANKLTGWEKNVLPQARYVAELACLGMRQNRQVAAEQAIPVYIRDNVAVKSRPVQ